ncbi:uncharacterized protein K441DRAFT_284425 [Cenococcum geophilum 1.58]|uniref:uncharacterized protein n=1 Tax=Cenococcum geophilum 1.58 TaxID=794803 RepID=UPI00358FB7FE|nr:hypothetical protein K441DRAFT_284425 [Cenococcum geophilum 1.58]
MLFWAVLLWLSRPPDPTVSIAPAAARLAASDRLLPTSSVIDRSVTAATATATYCINRLLPTDLPSTVCRYRDFCYQKFLLPDVLLLTNC